MRVPSNRYRVHVQVHPKDQGTVCGVWIRTGRTRTTTVAFPERVTCTKCKVWLVQEALEAGNSGGGVQVRWPGSIG